MHFIIAYGRQPSAITAGANDEELEKRISTELISGAPALFLDNMNGRSFRSDLLASDRAKILRHGAGIWP